jgi:tetratricopeptide (TPR) repeat protein
VSRRLLARLAPLFLLALSASLLLAQPLTESPELRLLRTCLALADSGRAAEAHGVGRNAEGLFRAKLATDPRDVESLVGAARALSQCQLPGANFLAQGDLSSNAIELLELALELAPEHWMARFILASILHRSPAFLGRGKRAALEFDRLLRQQGDRNDEPRYARVFELRGLQLQQAGEQDSARVLWERGAALFPADERLRQLVEANRPPAPEITSLAQVTISATATPVPAPLPSVREISRSQVLLPAGGAADIIQAVQAQPGATRVGEGTDVYTRGGEPGETALLLNGGRLLTLARFEGLSGGMFGALEPFVVKSVKYSSGGFSARHGNALSGVIEIETDGKPRERQMRAGVSLVQLAGTVRTSMGPRLGGWVSARASRTGALLAAHGRADEYAGAPHSEEMIASMIATPSPLTELRATALLEQDDSRRIVSAAGWTGPFRSTGSVGALQVNGRWVPSGAPVVVRSSVSGTSRSSEFGFGVLSRDRDEAHLVARTDIEWQASPALMVRAGVERAGLMRAERGTVPTTPSVAAGAPSRALSGDPTGARHLGGYSEADVTVAGSTLTVGARADRLPGESDWTFDPRAALSHRRGAWTARLSTGVFHQGHWRGESAILDGGTPSGTATEARHLLIGLEREGPAGTLRVESYGKRYGDYRPFGSGPAIAGGEARGIDLTAQSASAGRVTGWLGYSYLDATVLLVDGRRVRSPVDVTHSATASATAAIGTDWSIGSTVRYGTGAPLTPITGSTTEPDGRVTPMYGAPMSARLGDYARVDLRLMRFVRTSSFLLSTFIEVINLGDRANATALTYDATYNSSRPVHTFFAERTIVVGAELQWR